MVLKKIWSALETFTACLGLIWILVFDLDELAEWLKQYAGEWIP